MNTTSEPATQQLSRRERVRVENRRDILAAAYRVFSEKGYHGATIEDIASAAEFSVGTIYNFFASKDELYAQVFGKLIEEMRDRLRREACPLADPAAGLAEVIRLFFEAFYEHRLLVADLFAAGPARGTGRGADFEQLLGVALARDAEIVGGIFARAIGTYDLADEDPEELALCLIGMIHMNMEFAIRTHRLDDLAERIPHLQRLFLRRFGMSLDRAEG